MDEVEGSAAARSLTKQDETPAFTPGPWTLGRRTKSRVRIDGHMWAELASVVVAPLYPMGGRGDEMFTVPGEANARLISAAPEMCEAIFDALAFINDEYACERSSALDGDPLSKEARPLRDKLCAALAKATGGVRTAAPKSTLGE